MTRAELHKKYDIRMSLSPQKLHEELSPQEAKEYEEFLLSVQNYTNEITSNIGQYCTRCNYYKTVDSDKCDSLIHGCSYGVSCRYIGKEKGEAMSRYENRKIVMDSELNELIRRTAL